MVRSQVFLLKEIIPTFKIVNLHYFVSRMIIISNKLRTAKPWNVKIFMFVMYLIVNVKQDKRFRISTLKVIILISLHDSHPFVKNSFSLHFSNIFLFAMPCMMYVILCDKRDEQIHQQVDVNKIPLQSYKNKRLYLIFRRKCRFCTICL